MNNQDNYLTILNELAEILREKNSRIDLLEWQNKVLKEKLEAAEKESESA